MDNIASYYNDPGLQQAQQQSSQAGDAYKTATMNAATMPDMLKQALDKKFSENNPLIQQRSEAAANYMNETTNAPLTVLPENNNGMIFNPMEQANMIQGRRSSALIPVMNANELLSWQQGGIQNTVDSSTRMYQALAQAAAIEAENKRNSYRDLLELIGAKASAADTDRKFQEDVRRFGLNYALQQQQEARLGSESGGSDLEIMLQEAIAGVDLNGDGVIGFSSSGDDGDSGLPAPTEAKPTRAPSENFDILGRPANNKGRMYRSPKGEWVFDWETEQWVPDYSAIL